MISSKPFHLVQVVLGVILIGGLAMIAHVALGEVIFKDRFEPPGSTPVEFATIELRDSDGNVKASTQSDADGNFERFSAGQISAGDSLAAYGGFWGGKPFPGEFRFLITDPSGPQNITPITTLVAGVARAEFIDGSTPEQRLTNAVELLIGLYMIDDDWASRLPSRVNLPVQPSVEAVDGIQNWVSDLVSQIKAGKVDPAHMEAFPHLHGGILDVQVPEGARYWLPSDAGEFGLNVETGLDAPPDWIWALVSGPEWLTVDATGQLEFEVPDSASTQIISIEIEVTNPDSGLFREFELEFSIADGTVIAEDSIGSEGGSVWTPDGTLGVEVPVGALSETVDLQLVEFTDEIDRTRTRFRTIPLDTEFDESPIVHFGGSPDVTMFDSSGRQARDGEVSCIVPDHLLEPDWSGRMCIEDDFVETRVQTLGFYYRWAVAENRLPAGTSQWALPDEGNVRFEVTRNVASVLTARCESCEGRVPVIFIHGFTDSGVGGGPGTWQDFAELLHSYDNGNAFAVYEFRYRSNARFEEIARDLGMAIEMVADETSQKANLVAHSFGGLVARTYLQGLADNSPGIESFENCDESRHPYVDGLLTLGTPHSGIADQSESLHGVWLPRGVHGGVGNLIDATCSQLTCWQAGARGDVFNLESDVPVFSDLYAVDAEPGKVVAQLHDFGTNLLSVPVRSTLALMDTWRDGQTAYAQGDGLISYQGQRFSPLQSCSGSQCANASMPGGLQTAIDGQALGHCMQERVLGGGGSPQPMPLEPVAAIGKLERVYRHSGALVHHNSLPAEPSVNSDEHLPGLNPDGSGSWSSMHDTFNQLLAWLDPGPPERNIALVIDGQGSVQVDSGAKQTNCDSNCVVSVPDATATLTALPDTSANFDQFMGCESSGTNECTLDVGPWSSVTARFTGGGQARLEVSVSGNGAVNISPDGHECSDFCAYDYDSGTSITLQAEGDFFNQWSGQCSGSTGSQCSFSLGSAGTTGSATANFESPPPQFRPLNDTGIDWCGNDDTNHLGCPVASHPGQDGDFGRDALAREGLLDKVGAGAAGFDYTKLDANGNDLPASATDWSCVRDNHTGLIWEVKTTDGGLQDKDNTYTWYNPDPDTNGGDPGVQDGGNCTGSACDTHGYVQAVNAQGLCGASDWRMPAVMELHSLTHQGRWGPAIDTDYLPNTPSSLFWSASQYAGALNVWNVHFGTGHESLNGRALNGRIRLVRSGQ